MKKLIDLVIFC